MEGSNDWTVSYSNLRGEIYVFDQNNVQVFSIPEYEIPEGLYPEITYEELKAIVREHYAFELRDFNLIP